MGVQVSVGSQPDCAKDDQPVVLACVNNRPSGLAALGTLCAAVPAGLCEEQFFTRQVCCVYLWPAHPLIHTPSQQEHTEMLGWLVRSGVIGGWTCNSRLNVGIDRD